MSQAQFIKDIPEFVEWFDPTLNPNLDISMLHVSNYKDRIFYMRKNGDIGSTTASDFMKNLRTHGVYIEPKKSAQRSLAIDDPVFNTWFDAELNPDIDLTKLCRHNCKVEILYKRKDNQIGGITANSFFRNIKKNHGCFVESKKLKKIKSSLAIDDPIFREWFDPEINPDIDISKIVKWNTEKKIKYIGRDNKIHGISAKKFFDNVEKNNGVFIEPNHLKRKAVMEEMNYRTPWDFPVFREWFNQELNPEIDPTQLQFDSNIRIRYVVNEYTHAFFTVKGFFRNIEEHKGLFQPVKTNVEIKKIFWKWFDPKLNPTIDPFLIKVGDTKTKMKYKDVEGNIHDIIVGNFFHNVRKNGDFIPLKMTRIIEGVNDAATIDPEIILFWDEKKNKQQPNKISPNTGHQYHFICPYCGYEFTKQIKNIAGKSPKCPQCHDKEKPQKNIKDMPSDVAFLLRSLAPEEE